jgi:hypothetical protein
VERKSGHLTLEAPRAEHGGGAPVACRQDRQQHSCGRLKRTAAADDDVCGTPVPAGGMVAVLP